MNKRIGIALAGFAVVAVGLWVLSPWSGSPDAGIRASGTVEATDAQLGFLVAGRVGEVFVVEGQTVSSGAELARLDTREIDAQLDAARADVRAAEAVLAELEAGARTQEIASAEAALRSASRRAEEAERNAVRATELFEGGAISRQAFDRAVSEHDIARAAADQANEALALVREGPREQTLRVGRARLEQARAQLARVEATRSNSVILAPFDGVVTMRHREPGEAVSPGAPVITLLDPSERWVRIYVREDRMGGIQLGASARIVSDTYPDRVLTGEVVFIGSEAEFTPRNVQTADERTRLVYPVRVRITGDPEMVLKPGLPADVTLEDAGG